MNDNPIRTPLDKLRASGVPLVEVTRDMLDLLKTQHSDIETRCALQKTFGMKDIGGFLQTLIRFTKPEPLGALNAFLKYEPLSGECAMELFIGDGRRLPRINAPTRSILGRMDSAGIIRFPVGEISKALSELDRVNFDVKKPVGPIRG